MTLYLNEFENERVAARINSAKEEKFCRNLRRYLREYSGVTGFHGFRYLTEKRTKVEKCVWAVMVLFSLIWCVYMIYEIIQKYKTSPVVVSYATRETPIYEIPFPAVTICPETKFSAALFNYTETYFDLEYNVTISDEKFLLFQHMSILCNEEMDEENFRDQNIKTVDYETLIDLAITLKPRFAVYCIFMKNSYDEDLACLNSLTPTITDQGLCYSFNIPDRTTIFRDDVIFYKNFFKTENQSSTFDGDYGYAEDAGVETFPRRALMSGADNALEIYLLSNNNDHDYLCSKFHQGFRIMIHNPMDIPRLTKHYFRVPPQKSVVAAVHPERVITSDAVKAFRPDKRQCYLRSERPLKYFKIYTQSNCMLECVANYTMNKCGCLPYFMPRNHGSATCGPGSGECVEKAERKIEKIDKLQNLINSAIGELAIKDLEAKISKKVGKNCDCKPLCSDLKFNVETSHSDFMWKEFFKMRKNINFTFEGDDVDEIEQFDYSVVSIYFKSEQFMTLERNELYGFSDFVSNFGGLVGLFTGCSLLSLVEIIYFLTLRIFYNERFYGRWSGPS